MVYPRRRCSGSNRGSRLTRSCISGGRSIQTQGTRFSEKEVVEQIVLSDLPEIVLVANEISMSETSSAAAEEVVWRGTSSQWKNFGVYLLCGLFCWLLVPIFFALIYYFRTKCKVFELTTQRFKIFFFKDTATTETLELYRVK